MNTDSAQQALSAKQGTVIKSYIQDTLAMVDLSQITEQNYSIGDSAWGTSGKHKVIPVTPGDTYRLTTSTVSGDGFWAFFTSAYTPPTSVHQAIPYVYGWRNKVTNATCDVVVPEGAAYLCICPKDGGGKSVSWEVGKITTPSALVPRNEVKQEIYSPKIPAGLTKYDYQGVLVDYRDKPTHKVAAQKVSEITSETIQGGACFGSILFMFKENNSNVFIYNLDTKTLLQTYTMPDAQKGFVSNCHCNTVNFGTEYYDENDSFPLLYVSTNYASDGNSGVLVYRIVETTVDDVTTYSFTLVQTVKIPGTGWSEFIVGEDGNCFIKFSDIYTIYRMAMPKLSDGDFTFDLDDAMEVYKISPQSFSPASQNHLYKNGKIYIVAGAAGAANLFVLDLATRTRDAYVDIYAMGYAREPETIFFWRGMLCVAFRTYVNIIALFFE